MCIRVRIRICVSVSVYLFIYIYVCVYAHVHVHVYVCMLACVHMCMHGCRDACSYACLQACMCVCMHIHACIHICLYIYTRYDMIWKPEGGRERERGQLTHGGTTCTCTYRCYLIERVNTIWYVDRKSIGIDRWAARANNQEKATRASKFSSRETLREEGCPRSFNRPAPLEISMFAVDMSPNPMDNGDPHMSVCCHGQSPAKLRWLDWQAWTAVQIAT